MEVSGSNGARLKEIRLKKGLSLEDAHKKTKIHTTILKAIEEDNLAHMSPIYIKGFLKIYCKFLDVDPREFIAGYKEPQGTLHLSAYGEGEGSFKKRPVAVNLDFLKPLLNMRTLLLVAGVMGAIVLVGAFGKLIAARRARLEPPAPAPVVAVRRTEARSVKKAKAASAVKQERAAQPAQAAIPAPSRAATAAQEDAPRQAAPAVNVRLILRAKADCYVQVKTDGHTVFQGILKKAKAATWTAKEKISLSLGNAGAVELEVNGRPIPPLGRKGQALKNIVITRDGLSVQ